MGTAGVVVVGAPGAGAEEQASRRARRLARLREEAARGSEVDEALLRKALADQRAWSVGAEGERHVAEVLTTMARYGWTALHDVHWPGRPQANIDHIAVGPGGVVVIDAKNWSGTVTVRDGVLRQNGYQRARQADGVAQASAAVTTLLPPEHRTATRAVLCLAAQDQVAEPVQGVDVVGRWQLPELLLGLPPRLSVYEVADIARALQGELDGPSMSGRPRKGRATRRSGTSGRGRATARRGPSVLGRFVRLALTLVGVWVAWLIATHMLASIATQLAP